MKIRKRPGLPAPRTIWVAFALSCAALALLLVLSHVTEAPAEASDLLAPTDLQSSVPPAVTVSTDIIADTTWTKDNSPYQVTGNVSVQQGVTLTVAPGVEVQFAQYAGLTVWGKLTATGTASLPITFTATNKTPGWWEGISVKGSQDAPNNTGSSFSYVTVEYGGRIYDDLDLTYAAVTLTNSTFSNSGHGGVYGSLSGVANITDTTFTNNLGYAAMFQDGSVNPVLARLTATGNGYDGVGLGGGAMEGDHIWEYTGIPYIVTDRQTVGVGASLIVQPGTEVRFQQYAGLTSLGKLTAPGTASEPITFTGTTKNPGWWDGISVKGSQSAHNDAGATFDHTTIEYGGYVYSSSNLYVTYSQVAVSNSTIRYSSADGVYAFYGGSGSTIQASQIVSNAGFGVRNNDPVGTVLLAANNWWGDASGPTITASPCNPNGTGSRVNAGVAFTPFLTSPGSDAISPGSTRILAITPQRWFVPADGVTRAWVNVTVRSGDGQPLPGRTVRLQSSLGAVVDGNITDIQGQALAHVTSSVQGDALLTASLDAQSACDGAHSAQARITFTPTDAGADLLPNEAAPYLNGGIEISPEPITEGMATRIRARVKNPNNFPISVNATFGIAQLGIGLAFGPVGEVLNKVIDANAEDVIEVTWTPSVSGHYCIRFEYAYQPVGAVTALQSRTGSSQRNVNVAKASKSPRSEGDSIKKAREATKAIEEGHLAAEVLAAILEGTFPALPFAIPSLGVGQIIDFNLDKWSEASDALAGAEDPPRLDYNLLATPENFTFTPLQAGTGLSAARAESANQLVVALLDQTAKLRAALVSRDRYGGACEANDVYWATQQAGALKYYKVLSGQAMVTSADRLESYFQALRSDGYASLTVTADAVRSYQARLRTQGFNSDEIQAARLIGMTDGEIEAMRQRRINADPNLMAGDQMVTMGSVAYALRSVGQAFIYTPPPFTVTAGSTERTSQAASHNLTRVYHTNFSFQVGNPLTQTATISLTVRRVDLPSDWMVTTTPMSVTLAAGGATTITVSVEPGSATVQSTKPRVAVEAYASNQLLGGVVLDVLVPQEIQFDGKLRVYLPAAYRSFHGAW